MEFGDKKDPFSQENLPEESGPAKVNKNNLKDKTKRTIIQKPKSKFSWLIAFIPIIIIAALIIVLNEPKEEGIRKFDEECMQIHPMSETYNCLATMVSEK